MGRASTKSVSVRHVREVFLFGALFSAICHLLICCFADFPTVTTLDRYIARQYLFNTCALLVLLGSFVVAVDVSLNIDRFLAAADRMEGGSSSSVRKGLVTMLLVAHFWWPKLLQLFVYMVGLALVGAMGFTFTQMVRHRETVAALAGGISLRRLARPVLIVAALMMGLKWIDQEFILSNPHIAPLLSRDHGDAGNREWSASAVPPTADGSRRVFMAREFVPRESRLVDVNVWERDAQGALTRHLVAGAAVWRDGAWEMESAREMPVGLAPSGSDAAMPAQGVPVGAGGAERLVTDLDPATLLLRRDARVVESLSWGQIGAMLASPRVDTQMRDKLVRVRWGRVSIALSTFLSLLITMPFFLVREPRNMLVQSLKCAPVGIVALMGGVFGASTPVPGLPVLLAVFLPVLVLIPIAIASWSSVRT